MGGSREELRAELLEVTARTAPAAAARDALRGVAPAQRPAAVPPEILAAAQRHTAEMRRQYAAAQAAAAQAYYGGGAYGGAPGAYPTGAYGVSAAGGLYAQYYAHAQMATMAYAPHPYYASYPHGYYDAAGGALEVGDDEADDTAPRSDWAARALDAPAFDPSASAKPAAGDAPPETGAPDAKAGEGPEAEKPAISWAALAAKRVPPATAPDAGAKPAPEASTPVPAAEPTPQADAPSAAEPGPEKPSVSWAALVAKRAAEAALRSRAADASSSPSSDVAEGARPGQSSAVSSDAASPPSAPVPGSYSAIARLNISDGGEARKEAGAEPKAGKEHGKNLLAELYGIGPGAAQPKEAPTGADDVSAAVAEPPTGEATVLGVSAVAESVARLVDMGFGASEARYALRMHGSYDDALRALQDEDEQPAEPAPEPVAMAPAPAAAQPVARRAYNPLQRMTQTAPKPAPYLPVMLTPEMMVTSSTPAPCHPPLGISNGVASNTGDTGP